MKNEKKIINDNNGFELDIRRKTSLNEIKYIQTNIEHNFIGKYKIN